MTTQEGDIPQHSDAWSVWLLHRRHGGDPDYAQVLRATIDGYAKRVVEGAHLKSGMTLVDIGTGDGLIAFLAIDQVGPALNVICTDISAPLLQHVKQLAESRGVLGQCTFLLASAECLGKIEDTSVDAVTTRSALAYVPDKAAAMREFHRILKPGGRLSMGEPIIRDDGLATIALRSKVIADSPNQKNRVLPLIHRWKSAQFPDTLEKLQASPLTNYSERDLLRLAKIAGFTELKLDLHISMLPSKSTSWEVFLDTAPHPLAPCLREIMTEQFSAEERLIFENAVRPIVEHPDNPSTDRMAYLTATKPTQRR
jgi:arsenite methyltransferase